MKGWPALIFMLVNLAACSAKPEQVVTFGGEDLDCAVGFNALVQQISSTPGIVADVQNRGASAYRDDRALSLFVVTSSDHPAHPAVFVRRIFLTTEGSMIGTSGCGYGDRAALAKELQIYSDFDRLLNAEEECFLCDSERLVSPTVFRRMPPPPLPPANLADGT